MIPAIKHLHQHGTCLSGLKTMVNSNLLPPESSLIPSKDS